MQHIFMYEIQKIKKKNIFLPIETDEIASNDIFEQTPLRHFPHLEQ